MFTQDLSLFSRHSWRVLVGLMKYEVLNQGQHQEVTLTSVVPLLPPMYKFLPATVATVDLESQGLCGSDPILRLHVKD